MQLHSAMPYVWRMTLLLLGLFSSAYAATERYDLEAKNNDNEFAIIELLPGEVPDGNYYNVPALPPSRGVFGFKCVPGRKYTTYSEKGKTLIGCCRDGDHLSGNLDEGFSCCGPNTERKGSTAAGYACCAKGQDVKLHALSGKSRCCDAGQELVGDDKTTGLACCPAGKKVSGDATTNDPAKYMCCDEGTERVKGTGATGYACCPPGTKPSGDTSTNDPSKYMCCKIGTERKGDTNTGYHCCGEGEDVFGDMNKGYACCPIGQHISGDAKTGKFLCCGDNHERSGDDNVGWFCCLEGWQWDGKVCNRPKLQCENGKQLGADGKCACPTGSVEDSKGKCVPTPPPPAPPAAKACSSGIVSGKCYQIINGDGKVWGSTEIGYYVAWSPFEESAHFKAGKFQFCRDPECEPGLVIDPGTGFSIRDKHGLPPGGSYPNAWINNVESGGHMAKTMDYSKAGLFTVTKWPCGKYCIGGAPKKGLGYTCPTGDKRGMTFYRSDPEACLEVTLKEVPCNIRDQTNNCIWKTPSDQCCGGPVDCTNPAVAAAPAPAAQKPIGGK